MTTAEEIRDGLDFLITEAKSDALVNASIETGAQHDVFYVGLHYDNCPDEHWETIRVRMKKLNWIQVEHGRPLGFTHST